MLYILASILSSTLILILFRWIGQSAAVTRHAIAVSYVTSAVAGTVIFDVSRDVASLPWFWPAALEGIAFYVVFRLMALTTQTAGITVASIATKTSVVIPAAIGLVFLGETVGVLKVSGILAGLVAIFLAAGSGVAVQKWLLPLLVFVCTGLIDASFKLFQVVGLSNDQFAGFTVTIFGFAFLTAIIHHLILPDRWINRSSALSGFALGLANLGTVYFLLKALAQPQWESSIVYPLNNFGIVLASSLVAILVFRERPVLSTKLSLVFATASIALLYAAS